MSSSFTQAWLAALQARFTSVLRAPLVVRGDTLQADSASYPADALADVLPSRQLSAAERLSVYRRQYWMRLLRTLQEQYPLTTALCSPWFFNQHAIAFLCAHPPASQDLGQVVEGFDAFLSETVREDPVRHVPGGSSLPRRALLQAARIDAAFRHVFLAPAQPVFQPSAADEAAMRTSRLRLSQSLSVVEEHWPLVRLRAQALQDRAESRLSLPAALGARQVWAVFRTERGVAHVPLEPEAARLIELLPHSTLSEALGQVETDCAPEARAGLPDRMQAFLAAAVRAGFFAGWAEG